MQGAACRCWEDLCHGCCFCCPQARWFRSGLGSSRAWWRLPKGSGPKHFSQDMEAPRIPTDPQWKHRPGLVFPFKQALWKDPLARFFQTIPGAPRWDQEYPGAVGWMFLFFFWRISSLEIQVKISFALPGLGCLKWYMSQSYGENVWRSSNNWWNFPISNVYIRVLDGRIKFWGIVQKTCLSLRWDMPKRRLRPPLWLYVKMALYTLGAFLSREATTLQWRTTTCWEMIVFMVDVFDVQLIPLRVLYNDGWTN